MSHSKRGTTTRPKAFPRPGEKRLKFNTAAFSGTWHAFTSRSARAISTKKEGPEDAAPRFTFDPRVTIESGLMPAPWSAPMGYNEDNYEIQAKEEPLRYELDEDYEDVLLNTPVSQSGKGQNKMIDNWLKFYGTSYLRHGYQQYEPLEYGTLCQCGSASPASFKCRDCTAGRFLCKECVITTHKTMPAHRIKEWSGSYLKSSSLNQLGYKIALGNHYDPCPTGQSRTIVLGETNGFHEVEVVFCRCTATSATSPSDYQQLLDALLKMFHLAATEGKLSGGRFYALLACQTPEDVMRRTKKRAGSLDVLSRQDLALRCPACPRLNVNYEASDVTDDNRFLFTTHISYDGSFQLIRRQRTADDHDISLTEGAMYFVDAKPYEAYLTATKDDAYRNTKVSDCNNHKAATGTWSKYEGLAVTGIGACSCARHAFYMPHGIVNYFKGERFAYTDFAIGSVLARLASEGCNNVGLYYDIYCHWQQHWWKRAMQLPIPVFEPLFFIGAIPKFHLAGHTESCYIKYSLNNMPGVGRLDAEGCERLWADANHASGSTANKGSGSREDSLNHLFQDWNWRKAIGVPLSTKPELKKGKWTSVYVAESTPAMSVTQSICELRAIERDEEEHNHKDTGNVGETGETVEPYSCKDWILEGVDIEHAQEKLRRDIKSLGKDLMPTQAIGIGRQRQALQERLAQHCRNASFFFTSEQLSSYVIPTRLLGEPREPGKPETSTLALPSRISRFCRQALLPNNSAMTNVEQSIREVTCLESLARVRTTSQQKALLLKQKKKNVRGEVHNTRVQSMLARHTARVDMAVWKYRNSRRALVALNASKQVLEWLRPLEDVDMAGLTSILQSDRTVGEGFRHLPWFWCVRSMKIGEWDDSEKENSEALKVEWFRGKARYERWEEEVEILKREMASVLFSFDSEANKWKELRNTMEASFDNGYSLFCSQQIAFWGTQRNNAFVMFRGYLISSSNATCLRAIDRFSEGGTV
ncbi:hypothetical protein RhiJN_16443 [Ceratobasidium sp. AG-Ba]|nr:hypothetical protein RhiJN_16443 [Ceratobasidium sp. AG-Ba]